MNGNLADQRPPTIPATIVNIQLAHRLITRQPRIEILSMAENIPPPSATTADATRGVPYYEKLKRDLRETLQKKRILDRNMVCSPFP